MNRTVVCLALAAAISLGAAGCRPSTPAPANGVAKRLLIGVIPKGTTQEFWKGVHAGALKASKELGVDILWQGPLREDDREEQIKVVDTRRVARRRRRRCSRPSTTRALRHAGSQRRPRRHPGRHLRLGARERRVRQPRRDRQLQGRPDGRRAPGEAPRRQGQGHDAPAPGRVGQHDGARTGLPRRDRGPPGHQGRQLEPVRRRDDRGRLPRRREPACRSTRPHRAPWQGIFTPNESTTFGMLRALQNAGLAGKVRFVGFDSSDKLVQGLRDGQIDALVLQNPVHMGYLGVKTMVRHLKARAGREAHRHRRRARHQARTWTHPS